MKRRRARVAFVLLLLGALAAAPIRAEEVEEKEPSLLATLLWERGLLLHALGQYELAVGHFRKSIEVRPTAEAHTYLGWSLSKLGRLEEAIGECKKAMALDPEFGNPYNDIGVYLIELGRPNEAIPYLEKAIRAKRYCCYQFAHFNMGRALYLRGELAEARRSFKRALEVDPDYAPAREALRALREQGYRDL
ncbi:MAG: tetratricopeptide repeat protein [Nitrospinota bacterium]